MLYQVVEKVRNEIYGVATETTRKQMFIGKIEECWKWIDEFAALEMKFGAEQLGKGYTYTRTLPRGEKQTILFWVEEY